MKRLLNGIGGNRRFSAFIGVEVVVLFLAAPLAAQFPYQHAEEAVEVRYDASQPVLAYRLTVDSADLSGFRVELQIRNIRDTFTLAMPAHPEYDEEYWKYVRDLTVESPRGPASIARRDSALWQVVTSGHEATVRYRIELPKPEEFRGAWRPFLSPTGGLVAGPYGMLYVLGAEQSAAWLNVEVPARWEIGTGLEPTSDPRSFFAPTIGILVDSPLLLGRLRIWRFQVDGVPHRVMYWDGPQVQPFDSVAMLRGIEGLARQAIALFGRAPYREFSFLLQDGSYGGLEHLNSVTLGTPSRSLAEDPNSSLQEIAHEYFHNWNLMRIRPVEYSGLDYKALEPSRGLWFSEGMSIYYSDLLLRRAGIALADSTRIRHLGRLLGRYLNNPGNVAVSPERISMVAYGATPDALGDYSGSTHTQGEVLGNMIDFMVRDATDGRRNLDDVMRAMMERFSGVEGFTGLGIQQAVASVCGCPAEGFFRDHVRGAVPLDFNRYLGLVGLRMEVDSNPALGRDGKPAPDARVTAWEVPGDSLIHLFIFNYGSTWRRHGLKTGDRLLRLNGAPTGGWRDFRQAASRIPVGDTVRVDVVRTSGPVTVSFVMEGYQSPEVRILELPNATEKQRRLRTAWLSGM